MKTLTTPASKIPNFGCSDERVKDLGWHVALIGSVHRDSEAIDQSNAMVLQSRLEEIDPKQEHWGVMRASHWAVGWIEHVLVDSEHRGVMSVLKEAAKSLEWYPILDEMHFSNLEMELHDNEECGHGCSYCEEGKYAAR